MRSKKPNYYEIYRKLKVTAEVEGEVVQCDSSGSIIRVDSDGLVLPEPEEEKWLTVLTFHDVVNFVFKDFQLTGGIYEYSFKEFYLCPKS